MMIVKYHICRYILYPLFTSFRKSEISFKYLGISFTMKAVCILFTVDYKSSHKGVLDNLRLSNVTHVQEVSVVDYYSHSNCCNYFK